MADLRTRVRKGFSSLTAAQKRLIQEILSHYEDYVFLSVDEAADKLGVHKSSLVRLAQALNYDGYPGLRADLQLIYRQEISPGSKLGHTLTELSDEHIFAQLVATETSYLQESLKTVRNGEIRQAAELIRSAHRVFICGRGPQGPLSELFAFRLRRLHLEPVTVTEEGRAILEKLQLLEANDVVFICSFLYIPAEYRMAIEWAKEKGSPVILVTDSAAMEMADSVDVLITARRGPATIYHTSIVPLAIVNAIVLTIAKLMGPEAVARLEVLQELRRRFGFDTSVFPKP